MSGLPQNWKNWIVENLLRGVDAQQLMQTLLQNGFCFEDCCAALGKNLREMPTYSKDAAFYAKMAKPALLTQSAYSTNHVPHPHIQLLYIDEFLTPSEAAELVELTKSNLRPSEISATSGFEGFRTSSTCDLPYTNHPAAAAVDQKIIDCLGLGIGEQEVIQAQHYAPTQQFKAHTDYFEPGTDEYLRFSKDGGQRTWTFMVYLSEGCKGGETEFPLIGHTFKPKIGRALIWNNLLPNGRPNPLTLHQAHPVEDGEKVVITKWFRDEHPSSS
ncbi:2OG-Fe(II) oxygenase [Aestuariibacter sp. AA17]|uniref:2OG-Fe(II) oxygenase n=1 Tax=Fluctibacter corallii TaxID=2984329 RepID=A0ABT3A839_9ALTE|nr:2OG-Fe(II) oxygenase [Aestuariibacter sp. AA17]MCV2884838.1 2OG-Fe(II) oxygenase [Aestuariibacter sp. AA17]